MTEFINHSDDSKWDVAVMDSVAGYSPIHVEVEGELLDLSSWQLSPTSKNEEIILERGEGSERMILVKVGDVWWVFHDGNTSKVSVVERGAVNTFDQMGGLTSPMPGKILTVMTSVGESVDEGQTLLILEAMKMENRICSPVDGVVSAIHFSEGDQVEQGTVLIEIDSAE